MDQHFTEESAEQKIVLIIGTVNYWSHFSLLIIQLLQACLNYYHTESR